MSNAGINSSNVVKTFLNASAKKLLRQKARVTMLLTLLSAIVHYTVHGDFTFL